MKATERRGRSAFRIRETTGRERGKGVAARNPVVRRSLCVASRLSAKYSGAHHCSRVASEALRPPERTASLALSAPFAIITAEPRPQALRRRGERPFPHSKTEGVRPLRLGLVRKTSRQESASPRSVPSQRDLAKSAENEAAISPSQASAKRRKASDTSSPARR